jgi:hypothetical protein
VAGAQHVPRHALGSCRFIARLGLAGTHLPAGTSIRPGKPGCPARSEAVRFIALGLAGTHLPAGTLIGGRMPGSGPRLSGSSRGSA